MARISKDQGINISLSTIASLCVIVPALWFIVLPILTSSVSEALGEEISDQITEEVAPIKGAFNVLLLRDMTNLRREIADLEFRRDNPPPDDWTAQDAQELVNLRLELESLQMALNELNREPEEE